MQVLDMRPRSLGRESQGRVLSRRAVWETPLGWSVENGIQRNVFLLCFVSVARIFRETFSRTMKQPGTFYKMFPSTDD